MNAGWKRALVDTAVQAGALRITRYLSRDVPKVLTYHRIASDAAAQRRLRVSLFERQMRLLKERCSLMTVSQLAANIRGGTRLPENTAVVTIDDGYSDVYEWAFPILKKLGIPATVYVTTDFVDGRVWLWPDLIDAGLRVTKKTRLSIELGGRACAYSLPSDNQRAWSEIADSCLDMQDGQKNAFIDELYRQLGVPRPSVPSSEYAPMTWSQVRELHEAGIEIGAHSRTHPSLPKVEHSERDSEIRGSKERIEQVLDAEVMSFAYPHGRPEDRDRDAEDRIKAAGFSSCVVAFHDGTMDGDLFSIRRHGVGACPSEFDKVVYGYDYLARRLGFR